MPSVDLSPIKLGMERELRENILPFWLEHSLDHENGGFYGALTNSLEIHNEVERSLVLCARVLWTFSSAYRCYGDPAYLEMAQHAFAYLTQAFLDKDYGGMYWRLDQAGQPVNDRKQTYGQAFAIYGLAEYYLATQARPALELAKELFALIEAYAYEPLYGGYVEGRARNWGPLEDMRLSEKEAFNCPKSMNTLLHVLEGYTNLLRAWPDERLKQQQANLLRVFLEQVIDPQTHLTRLFFENDWTSLSTRFSYGHDIETSWLLGEAAEVLKDPNLIAQARMAGLQMAEAVYQRGLDSDGAVLHEGEPAPEAGEADLVVDGDKHWWCQAEGIVGFVNAYQICEDSKYATAALRLWDFVQAKLIDRQHGEWFKVLTRAGEPVPGQVKTGPWEDPYHQARACMEVIRRI